ncbi:MAG TPA: hypothetical protein VLJ10_02035, partial [Candidatus Bathyarchaeia archaeon]|nr:hypothetical protein [Candidatus Bathyarchaeia archaeon]
MKLLHTLHSSPFTFHLKKLFKNSWFLALLLLGIFLATNGYIYGWDDQHVEIPLLKKLIDPTLYPNDYYVDALKANFMSYLYPVLAKVITIPQIPTAYLLLYLLSRYFLFFFMFKIWKAITKQEGLAFLCVLMTLLIGRVEEFLYRTFSHQEFALALIFTGMYLFYKNRPLLAAVVLGIAANIHALYSLFPMFYISVDLMRQKKWKDIIKSGLIFLAGALPFLIWAGKKIIDGGTAAPAPPASEWIPLYQLACPQNFVFYNSSLAAVFSSWKNFWDGTGSYWLLATLTIILTTSCRSFREDRRTQSVLIGGGILLILAFIFSYIWPSRFFLDLNLIRNSQYMLFFLMGYLIILLWNLRTQHPWRFLLCLLALPFIRFGMYQATLSVLIMGSVAGFPNLSQSGKTAQRLQAVCCFAIMLTAAGFLTSAMNHPYSSRTWWTLWTTEIGV